MEKNLEEEFKNYKIKSDFIETSEDLEIFLQVGIYNAKKSIKEMEKEKNINSKDKKIAQIKNIFNFLFVEEETSFYDEDNKIIEECISLALDYIIYFERMINLIKPDNTKELLKIVDFIVEYYNMNMDYLDSKRETLEYAYKGITFINSKYSDYRKEISDFFEKKINEYQTENSVEKKKKL